MIIALVGLGVCLIVILSLFVLQRKELVSVRKQIENIRSSESNRLVHSEVGLVDKELINDINQILGELRDGEIHFQRRNHEIEQMMTNISHDLRTPLTSALGYIDMVVNSDMSEKEKKETLAIVQKRMVRLKELIDGFFEFSKVISRDELPEMKETNLVSILEEAVSHYYDDFSDRDRKIDFKCETHKIMINTNNSMMMRVFDNLIGNSLKHGNGDLTIEVNKQDQISILFWNKLFDADLDVSRLFEEFYTTDISRTKGNTGLGLAIVKQFTNLLGGDITAEKDGDILRFNITF